MPDASRHLAIFGFGDIAGRGWIKLMNALLPMTPPAAPAFGISAIATYRPETVIANDWYGEAMPRKFVRHTGIERRSVSFDDEVTIAARSIRRLIDETGCDPNDCAGIVLTSPSLIPMAIAHRYLDRERARAEQPNRVARQLAQSLRLRPRSVLGINGFCSGYARAMKLVKEKLMPRISLSEREFVLVVTASRISRITDYGCKQSGALFGDFATATLISRCDSYKYPTRFEILDASYGRQSTARPHFDFSVKQAVPVPHRRSGRGQESRLVFSLDGMGIADAAPRAMAAAAADMIASHQLDSDAVRHIVPHQAGEGIVRFTQMKLEQAGFSAEVVNGQARTTGNISSGSVPLTLKNYWNRLSGPILCPVAAVGAPGKCEVSSGCLLLRAPMREELAQAS